MELIPMPAELPDSVNDGLAQNYLNANQRATLCRSVVHGLAFIGRISNGDMILAADTMVKKYPPMKRHGDPTNVRF